MPAPKHGGSVKATNAHMRRLHEGRTVRPEEQASVSGMNDPLVVSTALLAAALTRWAAAHEADHELSGVRNGRPTPARDELSWIAYLAEWSRVPERSILRVVRRETKTTTLGMADRLLTAADMAYAIGDEIPVVPNPRWNQERWHEYMRERGCEPE